MRLFCLRESYEIGDQIILNEEESHRLLYVLRLAVGSQFEARDPFRCRYQVELCKAQKNKAILSILSKTPYQHMVHEVILWQAIPKQQRFQEVIPLAIEAGVAQIVPMITERTQISFSDIKKRTDRWHRIAMEAVDQSGNNDFLQVAPATNLKNLLENSCNSLGFFAHQEPISQISMTKVLKGKPPSQPIVLAIGPEGGFSEAEVSAFRQHHFQDIFFADSVLRSEHAGLFFLGAIKMLLQESCGFYGEISSSKN